MGHYVSFIVRLWVDNIHEMNTGYIQCAGNQDYRYFKDFSQAIEFMLEYCNRPTDENEYEEKGQTNTPTSDW
jgi:hypothetical protein